MNPIDIASLAVLAVSAAVGLVWGFVGTVLGLGAWVAAGLFCDRLFPLLDPTARRLIENRGIADIAAYAAGFIALVIVLTIVANLVGRVVQASVVGGIDRALGLLLGAGLGAALIVGTYILGTLVQAPDAWPPLVRNAHATPLAYRGAVWAVSLVPRGVRPHIDPPGGGSGAPAGQTVAYRPGSSP